jgi:uncharacterized protein YecA (UPF0149 family)
VTGNPFEGELSCKRNSGLSQAASADEVSPPKPKLDAAFRVVGKDKELFEKLGRNDLCPCGSARRFQELLYESWPV